VASAARSAADYRFTNVLIGCKRHGVLAESGISGEINVDITPDFLVKIGQGFAKVLGGGKIVRPGEISLAHLGILFLDEAPEFRQNVLQALREPLEDRVISISRAEGATRLPADFQLILAANPCPCGNFGRKSDSNDSLCFCSSEEIRRYWRRLGGALLDRVELRVRVKEGGAALAESGEESSAVVAARVLNAVDIQRRRFAGSSVRRNAAMPPAMLDHYCALRNTAEQTLRSASAQLGLSGRAVHSSLRVARTIADLESSPHIQPPHLLEALQHRLEFF
jgi:magnesium chelatase family protein